MRPSSRVPRRGAPAGLLLLAALAVSGRAAASETAAPAPPEPFQLVRSLQLVQDRIANGDHAVLPMQRKVLEMADKALRAAGDETLADPRNFRAVLVYAMSGGNPATVEILLPRLIGAAKARAAAEAEAARAARIEAGEEEEQEAPAGEQGHGGGHGEAAAKAGHGGEEAKDGGGSGHGGKAAKSAPPERPKRSHDELLALGVFNYLRGRPEDARAALLGIDPMAEPPELGAFLALVRGGLEAAQAPADAARLLDQARLLGTGTLVEEAALRRAIALAAEAGERDRFVSLSDDYARRFVFSPYAAQWADGFVEGVMTLREHLDFADLDRVTASLDPERRRVLFLRIARRAGIEHASALAEFASVRAEAEKGHDDPRATLYSALPKVATQGSDDALAALRTIDPQDLTAGDRELLHAATTIAEGLVTPHSPAPSPVPPDPPPAASDPATDASAETLAGARKALEDIDKLLGETR